MAAPSRSRLNNLKPAVEKYGTTDESQWNIRASISYLMFYQTAQRDYALARLSFFSGDLVNYHWHAAQSVEKFLKFILLKNGFSVKKSGHKIESIYKHTRKNDLLFYTTDDYNELPSKFEPDFFVKFIRKIDREGNPHIRYRSFSTVVKINEINLYDKIIFSLVFSSRTKNKCHLENQLFYIEEFLREIKGKFSVEKALRANPSIILPEWKKIFNLESILGFSAQNSPIFWLVAKINEKEEGSLEAKSTVQWVIDNIQLDGQDIKGLKKLID